MKLRFTLNILMVAVFAAAFNVVLAQPVNTLTIDAPANVAGTYFVDPAQFGATVPDGFTGDLILLVDGDDADTNPGQDPVGSIHDACNGDVTNVEGFIAMLDRGDCQFGSKALAAEAAGAVGVIICNFIPNDGAMPDMISGDDGDMVTVPSMSMSKENCDILRMAVDADNSIEGTFSYIAPPCPFPDYGAEVVWGNAEGQGDFSGGLNGWTVEQGPVGDSSWVWSFDGTTTGPLPNPGSFTNFTILSETACNGAMLFNSDYLDNGGQGAGAIGTGVGGCPRDCIGTLISPEISLVDKDVDGLFLRWHQALRNFFSTYYVLISEDGGATWPDTVQVNSLGANTPNIDEELTIPLVGYEDAESVTVAFLLESDYYYWLIDDVRLVSLESFVDVGASTNTFYATTPQFKTPASQVSSMPFVIDIFNFGNLTADGLQVRVDITDDSGANVYSQTKDYDPLEGWSLNENESFAESTTPPAVEGLYNGSYTVIAPGDMNPDNDVVNFSFLVTDKVYGNTPNEADADGLGFTDDFEPMTDGSIFADGANSETLEYTAGVVFRTETVTDETFTKLRFGITEEETPQTLTSGTVFVEIFEILNPIAYVGNGFGQFNIEATDRIAVGGAELFAVNLPNSRFIEVDISEKIGDVLNIGTPMTVKSNTNYLIVLQTKPLNSDQIDLISYPASDGNNESDYSLQHGGSNIGFEALGEDRVCGTVFQEAGGDPAAFANLGIDGYGINELWLEVDFEMPSGTDDFNEGIAIETFPNPTFNNINVALNLTAPSDVTIEIVDIQGQLVSRENLKDVTATTIVTDMSYLPNGTYIVKVTTEEGFNTETIVVSK